MLRLHRTLSQYLVSYQSEHKQNLEMLVSQNWAAEEFLKAGVMMGLWSNETHFYNLFTHSPNNLKQLSQKPSEYYLCEYFLAPESSEQIKRN